MEVLDRIVYQGYTIEILPDYDADNPFTEGESAPTLALHERAERNFGWSTDKDWASRLQNALDQIADHSTCQTLYGHRGALDVVNRWLKVAHGIPVVLHVSALDHSGVLPYLGTGSHFSDPGGWDSGWVGWLFATPEQMKEWGQDDPEQVEKSLRASFSEFAAWVSGDVVGYEVIAPDGESLTSCFGIYGSDAFREPDGWVLTECKGIIDADLAEKGTLHAVSADHSGP